MPTQRTAERRRLAGFPTSRRAFLGTVAGVAATGGCVGTLLDVGGRGRERVSALVAGSLQRTFERLRESVGPAVRVEAHGSVTVARLVADGKRDPDLVALADDALFSSILDASWHTRVATNELVVAYDDGTPGGRRVATADRWFEPVLSGAATLGRTDPDLDPLGYRTLFMLALSERRYDRPGLREGLRSAAEVHPETGLLSRFETGDIDAAVVYRNMADERDYEYRDLPAAVDLSDPDLADIYATASYDLPDGRTVRGAPITYGVQARTHDPATRAVFDELVNGTVLSDHDFGVPATFPEYEGAVPRGFR